MKAANGPRPRWSRSSDEIELAGDFEAAREQVAEAIRAANRAILAEAQQARASRWARPSSPCSSRAQRYAILWVGDSRAYLLRDGELGQLSRDHTQVQEMVDRGMMTPAGRGRPSDGPHPVARRRRARRGRGRPGRAARSSPATSSCSAATGCTAMSTRRRSPRLLARGSPERALRAAGRADARQRRARQCHGDRDLGQRPDPPVLPDR